MFGSCAASQVGVGFPVDSDLAELVWVDPADWEPEVDPALDHGLDTDNWDEALQSLVAEGIAESEALCREPAHRVGRRRLGGPRGSGRA